MVISAQQLQDCVRHARFATTRSRSPSLAAAVRTGFLAGILTFAACAHASSQDSQSAQSAENLTPQEVVRVVVNSFLS